MEFTSILFYVFSAVLVLASLQVITTKNPVHAALFLVLAFFNAAGIWMLLKAEFLSIVLVLVYVGAVMVLFLFVVMMLDINLDKLRAGFWSHFPVAALVGVVVVLEMSAVLWKGFLRPDNHVPAIADQIGNTKYLGNVIFTQYTYAFEVAAAIPIIKEAVATNPSLEPRTAARSQPDL